MRFSFDLSGNGLCHLKKPVDNCYNIENEVLRIISIIVIIIIHSSTHLQSHFDHKWLLSDLSSVDPSIILRDVMSRICDSLM